MYASSKGVNLTAERTVTDSRESCLRKPRKLVSSKVIWSVDLPLTLQNSSEVDSGWFAW